MENASYLDSARWRSLRVGQALLAVALKRHMCGGLRPSSPFDLSAQQEGATNRSIPERLTASSALRAGHGDDGVPWGYSVDAGGSPLPNTRSNHERFESLSIVLCCEATCSWRDAICEFFASSSRARAAFCS